MLHRMRAAIMSLLWYRSQAAFLNRFGPTRIRVLSAAAFLVYRTDGAVGANARPDRHAATVTCHVPVDPPKAHS